MIILRDISIIWSMMFTLAMFMTLFESKYPLKKTLIISASSMIPLLIINIFIMLHLGAERFLSALLLTCTLPSCIFFWFLAKHKGGRFLFTFCLSDTIWLEIMYITNIADFYTGNSYILMFILRLIAYPLITWWLYKYVRSKYFEIQNNVQKGWRTLATIGALFYVATLLLMTIPTMITERPEQLPAFIMILILMPLVYSNIFRTLFHQQELYLMTIQENILKVQVSDMTNRIEEFSDADNKFRIERHNFRHKMQTIARMVENKEYDDLRRLVVEYNEAIRETKVKRYCDFHILDAVFSSYISKAEEKGITVSVSLNFPAELSVNEAELATVFANAIENATNACEKSAGEKHISIKVIKKPRFMFQIENTFDGNVEFNENDVPVSHEEGHGFGTLSIVAFCNKNGATYDFLTNDNHFIVRVVF